MAGLRNVRHAARAGFGPIDDVAHRPEHHRMFAHTEIIAGAPNDHLTLQAVIIGLGKMTVGLEIARDPRSVFPLYELEMRLNKLIEIHYALCRLCTSVELSKAKSAQTI